MCAHNQLGRFVARYTTQYLPAFDSAMQRMHVLWRSSQHQYRFLYPNFRVSQRLLLHAHPHLGYLVRRCWYSAAISTYFPIRQLHELPLSTRKVSG